MVSSTFLKDLIDFPDVSVYAFLNDSEKKAYIRYKSSGVSPLVKEIELLKKGIHDDNELLRDYKDGKLRLEILYGGPSHTPDFVLMSHCFKAIKDLKVRGYSGLETVKSPIVLSGLKYVILNDFRVSSSRVPLVYVYLKSKRREKYVVGVFETVYEAKSWMVETYGHSKGHVVPKVKDNALTREYYEARGYKLETEE